MTSRCPTCGAVPKGDKNYSEEFLKFWVAYPKRINKPAAWKAWCAQYVTIDVVLKAIEQHKKTEAWLKDEGKFIPHPASWLNGRRWEDELEVSLDDRAAEDGRRRFLEQVRENA